MYTHTHTHTQREDKVRDRKGKRKVEKKLKIVFSSYLKDIGNGVVLYFSLFVYQYYINFL